MSCSECEKKKKCDAKNFTKAVIEINNPEQITLLRKVVIPASMGDDTVVKPVIGKYHNVVLHYEANKHTYLYSSDGIPTLLEMDVPQEVLDRITSLEDGLEKEIKDRSDADASLQENIDTEERERKNADEALDERLSSAEETLSTALQPDDIDKVMLKDVSLDPTSSSSEVKIKELKENLLSGAQQTESFSLPVASSSQAGVINSLTYDVITSNTNKIEALSNGAVAISGLPASPTQADLTSAWEQETGYTELMNRANIYDVTNDKVWTYYTNDSTWYAASNTSQVTVSTFTNNSEGIIKGSLNEGQVSAEIDGTGTVNGWTALKNSVDNKQDKLTSLNAGNAINIENEVINADVYPADFFLAGESSSSDGTTFDIEKSIDATLKSISLYGDTTQSTSFDSYVDVASPSLDYPQDVEVVTGEQIVTITKKNLFNENSLVENAYFEYEAESPTIVAGAENNIIVYIPCAPNEHYSFRVPYTASNPPLGVVDIGWTDTLPAVGVKVYGGARIRATTQEIYTYDNYQTGATARYLVIRFQGSYFMTTGGGWDLVKQYFQVEKGSSATSYETPQIQEYRINLGKNLFDKNNYNYIANAYFTDNEPITGTGDNNYVFWIPCKPNTPYSFRFPTATVNPPFGIRRIGITKVKPEIGTTVYNVTDDIQRTTETYDNYVTSSDAKYLCIRFQGEHFGTTGGGLYRVLNGFQIEEGVKASQYSAYKTPVELCKIGDHQDYIYKNGNDWYLHKEIGKYTLDGSYDWYISGSAMKVSLLSTLGYPEQSTDYNFDLETTLPLYSNYGTTGIAINIYLGTATDGVVALSAKDTGGGGDSVYAPAGSYTVNDWKEKMDAKPLECYYIVKTPSDTKITDTELVSQLEELGYAKSYDDYTAFSVSASINKLPAILNAVVYRKSLAGILAILSIFTKGEWDAMWA